MLPLMLRRVSLQVNLLLEEHDARRLQIRSQVNLCLNYLPLQGKCTWSMVQTRVSKEEEVGKRILLF